MFSGQIRNCYDSHVHWLATGEIADRLSLAGLTHADGVRELKVNEHHFRGEWLLGFGWNQNQWPGGGFPTHEVLDQTFGSDRPVAFSRADGHALWVNSAALRKAGLWESHINDPQGGRILRDDEGRPTGILIDSAMALIDRHIPQRSGPEARRALLKGCRIFNAAGITHIRDMSCDPTQWEEARHLEQSGLLTLAVEQYFSVGEGQTFQQALALALKARQERSTLLRPQGIKFYVDGALGSEGAWLSRDYVSGSGRGLQLYSMDLIAEMLKDTWAHGFDAAVHTIGDEAAHQLVLQVHLLAEKGIRGRLHLEHAEILRPDTIALMANQNIRCHLQPCHYLSDRAWLRDKIGTLAEYAFPWRGLQEASVEFDFGSDSPIEPPSIRRNLEALAESAAAGIGPLLGDPLTFHSHPDSAWVANCYTFFADGIATEVVFNGEHLL